LAPNKYPISGYVVNGVSLYSLPTGPVTHLYGGIKLQALLPTEGAAGSHAKRAGMSSLLLHLKKRREEKREKMCEYV
jgi:hypothetical protein